MKNTIDLIYVAVQNRLDELNENLNEARKTYSLDKYEVYQSNVLNELEFLQNLVETLMLELETKEI